MKYVVNNDYGGFSLPDEVGFKLGCDEFDYEGDIRTNEDLIEWVCGHRDDDLAVVEIPEEATDWEMDEYDGWESVIAVVNGRIVHLQPWNFEREG